MVSQEAQIVNAWASQDGAAHDLERTIKLARKFADRKSLAAVEKASSDYITRLISYLEMKERESVQV